MYDVIVVGAGHAGCEAAHIASFMGKKTLLVTSNLNNLADMPCNPSIGGSAKGIIVREIDALGGLMGKIADKSHFQIKMLNSSKGPAVRALRAQADKKVYPKEMRKELDNTQNLTLLEGMVEDLIIENNTVKGIVLSDKTKIESKTVVLTTGTYLNANILIGEENTPSGPHGEKRSNELSNNLEKYGLRIKRLKTGTPQRIKASSINFDLLKEETGDDRYWTFSFDNEVYYDKNEQQKCYLVYTNDKTHEIINNNLSRSSMYGGFVTKGVVGPRYCPSIEDKIVRFSDKERHQLFLEPESKYYDEWYLQGFSTSMPRDVQEDMVHSLKGLENAQITKYAYAIEYDAIDPIQITASLENKIIENLFTAGQINGTSGYEEAAGQGLIAGVNAALKIDNINPLILKRNEAYIGVLIDDLVTKGIADPYRMLTSRAEFRLLLRHDNADLRLTHLAFEKNAVSKEKNDKVLKKEEDIKSLINLLKDNKINDDNKKYLNEHDLAVPSSNISLFELLKRPEIDMNIIKSFINLDNYDEYVIEQVEIECKYMGYIKRSYTESSKLSKMESKQIPKDIDYDKVRNIASEARQKLKEIRPLTIAQASRISGVNPVDISLLLVYMKKEYGKDE